MPDPNAKRDKALADIEKALQANTKAINRLCDNFVQFGRRFLAGVDVEELLAEEQASENVVTAANIKAHQYCTSMTCVATLNTGVCPRKDREITKDGPAPPRIETNYFIIEVTETGAMMAREFGYNPWFESEGQGKIYMQIPILKENPNAGT